MSQVRDMIEPLWHLGDPGRDYTIRDVRAVLPGQILDGANVVVEDGRIAEISTGPIGGPVVDGRGLLLAPGFIDVHSDALEKERTPRTGADVPLEFAIGTFDGRVAAAGVTTVFHGAAFSVATNRGVRRTPERAADLCRALATTRSHRVDHRVLHRLDVLSAEGGAVLRETLDTATYDIPPLVSHEDHTPGQGQYADPSYLHAALVGDYGMTEAAATDHIAERVAEAGALEPVRRANIDWISELAAAGRIRLLGHDPATAGEIDDLVARHGHVAEFPTSIEAAEAARERGLPIVAGAPNVLRGGSHSGNVSAVELASRGLVDAIASDYLPPALLGAVFSLARTGITTLPSAIGLVTSGPARVAGLAERGTLEPGAVADLVVIDDSFGSWPRVVATMSASARR